MWLDTALRCVLATPDRDDDDHITDDAPTLQVVYTPLRGAVASLDTSGAEWVMYLDSDSPPEDHIWALFEALEILTHAEDAEGTAAPARHLRRVPDLPADR